MRRSNKVQFCWYSSLILLLFYAQIAYATEEYAKKTGKTCASCHVDPAGGGELTAEGKVFQNQLFADNGRVKEINGSFSLLRLIAGYLHILTAVFWFGTILYIHLVLKPAYAASGLPKGEVRVGLVSMFIMLVTGIYLTLGRVSSFSMLVETRFGILLLIKIILFLMMVTAALIAVFFIGPKLHRDIKVGNFKAGADLTAEELLHFNGKEGRPAYIAYAGNIYDVSKSGIWYEGIHFFKHSAGTDLTRFLGQAPHSEANVLRMPKIGRLVSPEGKKENAASKRAFYVLAYLNLTLVFLILLILALWKWWI